MFNIFKLFKSKSKFQKHSSNFYFSAAITTEDLKEMQNLNIKTIVSCVPDSELSNNTFPEIHNKSNKFKIKSYHIPFAPGQMTEQHIKNASELTQNNSGPFLFYCRSGKRAEAIIKKIK